MFTDTELTAAPATLSWPTPNMDHYKPKLPEVVRCLFPMPFPYKIENPVLYSELKNGETYLVRSDMLLKVHKRLDANTLLVQTKYITDNDSVFFEWSNNTSWHHENWRPLLLSMDYDSIPSINLSKIFLYGALGLAGIIGLSAGFNILNKPN